jgi:Spindle and kinetochore-associated protein 1
MENLLTKIHNLKQQIYLEENLVSFSYQVDEIEKRIQDLQEFQDFEMQELDQIDLLKLDLQQENLLKIWKSLENQGENVLDRPVTTEIVGKDVVVPEKVSRKPSTLRSEFDLLTPEEFNMVPSYILGRTTIGKINSLIKELNRLLRDKAAILKDPKTKQRKDLQKIFKMQETADLKGMMFVTESDLKQNNFSKSTFNHGKECRNVLTIMRTLGKMKEVRGGGITRFVVL